MRWSSMVVGLKYKMSRRESSFGSRSLSSIMRRATPSHAVERSSASAEACTAP